MRMTIAAVAVSLSLVAGQAATANTPATARIGDRVGAGAGENSEIAGLFLPTFLVGLAVVDAAAAVAFVSDDTSEID